MCCVPLWAQTRIKIGILGTNQHNHIHHRVSKTLQACIPSPYFTGVEWGSGGGMDAWQQLLKVQLWAWWSALCPQAKTVLVEPWKHVKTYKTTTITMVEKSHAIIKSTIYCMPVTENIADWHFNGARLELSAVSGLYSSYLDKFRAKGNSLEWELWNLWQQWEKQVSSLREVRGMGGVGWAFWSSW